MRDLTGGPINRLEHALSRHPDVGLMLLRLVVGGHPVVMTWDNVTSWARMLEFRDFLAHHAFVFPLACAVLSVAGQFLGGLGLVLGVYTRPAALIVAFNFVVAIWMVDAKAPYPAAFPALALVGGALCLAFTGPGWLSLDARLRERL